MGQISTREILKYSELNENENTFQNMEILQ